MISIDNSKNILINKNIMSEMNKAYDNTLVVSDNKQTIEEITNMASQVMDKKDIDNLFDLLKQSNMTENENITHGKNIQTEAEEQRKIAIAKNRIRRELTYAENNVTSVAIKELTAHGLSLEKISINMLNNVIKEIEPNQPKLLSPLNTKDNSNNKTDDFDFELQLRSHNVAVTDKNIRALEQVKSKLDKLKDLTDDEVVNILKMDKTLTLENVYKGKYTVGGNSNFDISDEDWKELTVEVEKSFNRDGIDIGEKAFKFAKLFIENEVPITKDNINKAMFLKNIPKYVNEASIINEATRNIKKDVKATEINLLTHQKSISQALDDFGIKRKSAFESNLNIIEAEVNEGNVKTMETLFDSLTSFKALKYNVFGDIINKNVDFTVNGINKSFKAAETLKDLEQFATVVSSKFGDSFSKVKNQFAPFLESLNIKPTNSNIKAASILTKNNIDVNLDNIINVSLIDSKISRVVNTLHPNIAANMIKDGINPLDMEIDEILKYIEKFNGEYGENLEDKISSYILELDQKNVLNKETRQSMIDIYRMLNKATKNDSVAIGLTLKKGAALTLGNLIEGSTNFKRTIGHSGDILSNKEAYDAEVVKQFIVNAEPDKLEKVIERNYTLFNDELTEVNEKLEQIDINKEVDNTKLEKQVEMVKDITKTSTDIMNWLERTNIFPSFQNITAANNLANNSFALLNDIKKLQNAEIDESDKEKLEKILSENNLDSENIKDLVENNSAFGVENKLLTFIDEIKSKYNKSDTIESINLLKKNLEFQSQLNNRIGTNKLNIPININDDLSGLNIYVVNNNLSQNTTQKIYLSLNTQNLGVVEMFINIGTNNIDINFNFEKTNNVIQNSDKENLVKDINEIGDYKINIATKNQDVKNMYVDEIPTQNKNTSKIINSNFQITV